jgi:hypothetical protein
MFDTRPPSLPSNTRLANVPVQAPSSNIESLAWGRRRRRRERPSRSYIQQRGPPSHARLQPQRRQLTSLYGEMTSLDRAKGARARWRRHEHLRLRFSTGPRLPEPRGSAMLGIAAAAVERATPQPDVTCWTSAAAWADRAASRRPLRLHRDRHRRAARSGGRPRSSEAHRACRAHLLPGVGHRCRSRMEPLRKCGCSMSASVRRKRAYLSRSAARPGGLLVMRPDRPAAQGDGTRTRNAPSSLSLPQLIHVEAAGLRG